MESIQSFLATVKLARKQVKENLAVFPLLAPDYGAPRYLTLEQALEYKTIKITEVDHVGSVPDLMLSNSGPKSVLIVEGEQLMGSKQNRIVNSSFLVPGKTEVTIPVSCVAKGCWDYRSSEFSSREAIAKPSTLAKVEEGPFGQPEEYSCILRIAQTGLTKRLAKRGGFAIASGKKLIPASLRRWRGFRSDQGKIWSDIDHKLYRLKSCSSTKAMSDLFEDQRDKLAEFVSGFRPVECQIGSIFAINGKIVGLEAFKHDDTFGRFFEKLVKSYALDAIDCMEEAQPVQPTSSMALHFVASILSSKQEIHPSLNLGQTVRFESKAVWGAALVNGARVLHLSAFKKSGLRKPLN